MIDVARLGRAPQGLGLPPQLVRDESDAQIRRGKLRLVGEGVTERTIVFVTAMPFVIIAEIGCSQSERHHMNGLGNARPVRGHKGRRANAAHGEAKAQHQSEDDREPDRHATHMPAAA